jgi:beta-lactamase class C
MQLRFAIVAMGVAFAAGLPAFGQARQPRLPRTVQSVVEPWIQKFEPPGVIVVIRREDETAFFPFGEADRERHVSISPDSIFELASVTKVFTTTSLAIEVDAGRMQLNDPVHKYLPALKSGSDIRSVTLQQLATHTSSLPRTASPDPRGGWDRRQLLDWLVAWHAAYPPGTRSLYSNLAVGVLGDAIAAKEQKPLQEVWDRQFLDPLDMKSTFFDIPQSGADRLVRGYNAKGLPVERSNENVGWPAAGRLCSSGRDMSKFLAANLGEAKDHAAITKAMRFAQRPYFKASEHMTQGLAWQLVHIDGELVIDKNGGLPGTSTYIGMIPSRRLGVVVMANRGKCAATAVGRRLLFTLVGGTPKSESYLAERGDAD